MVLKNIPNISFKTNKEASDIEFLRLAELFEKIEKDPNHDPKQPHRISFFVLLIVTEGEGVHQIDLKNYPISKGAVLKIAKGQVHAFQNNFQYDGYLVAFTEDFILRYFSKSSAAFISNLFNYHLSEPLIEGSAYNDFFIENFKQEVQSTTHYGQKEIIAKILELYLLRLEQQVHQSHPDQVNKKYQELFTAFKDQVEHNYTKTRNVKEYAAMLGVSAKHLNQITRELSLNTAKYFIDQYVILEIKRVLFSTDKSLKEVAFTIGFDELTNFSKFFKKHTGLSPKQYKGSL